MYRLLPMVLVLSACVPPVVEWSDPAPVMQAVADAAELRLAPDGRALFVERPPMTPARLPDRACPGSVVYARKSGAEWYAAWWTARGDGSVELHTSRTEDGGLTWTAPVPAEVRDRGARGCDRPAPGIAADSVGGYVHLVYWVEPAREQGIWYSHSMERGELWHEAVGIMFGTDPARATVAAHADTVVVAFEHPNAGDGRIGLAVSHTAGHIIEARTVASAGTRYASQPRVAVLGRAVAVSWVSAQGHGEGAPEHTVVRLGRLRLPERRATAAGVAGSQAGGGEEGADALHRGTHDR